jgi:metal-responsive CopG/Arc/MetJ family transcriptional regulator
MGIKITDKNSQKIANLIQQRDSAIANIQAIISVILDNSDIDYENKIIDLSEDLTEIILTEKETNNG